jgi:hypothetical protein
VELFAVSRTESRYRSIIDRAELTTRIVIVKDIVRWMLLVLAFSVDPFDYMYDIRILIVDRIYVTDNNLLGFVFLTTNQLPVRTQIR